MSGLTLFSLSNSKESTYNSPWFLTTGIGIKRKIRTWFKILKKLFATKENGDQKMAAEKRF
jgi:hypothetical protein